MAKREKLAEAGVDGVVTSFVNGNPNFDSLNELVNNPQELNQLGDHLGVFLAHGRKHRVTRSRNRFFTDLATILVHTLSQRKLSEEEWAALRALLANPFDILDVFLTDGLLDNLYQMGVSRGGARKTALRILYLVRTHPRARETCTRVLRQLPVWESNGIIDVTRFAPAIKLTEGMVEPVELTSDFKEKLLMVTFTASNAKYPAEVRTVVEYLIHHASQDDGLRKICLMDAFTVFRSDANPPVLRHEAFRMVLKLCKPGYLTGASFPSLRKRILLWIVESNEWDLKQKAVVLFKEAKPIRPIDTLLTDTDLDHLCKFNVDDQLPDDQVFKNINSTHDIAFVLKSPCTLHWPGVNEGALYANRAVLASAAHYFDVQTQFKEWDLKEFGIQGGCSPDLFVFILSYCYFGMDTDLKAILRHKVDICVQVALAADYFQMPGLLVGCQVILAEWVTKDPSADILTIMDGINTPVLHALL